MLSMPSNARTPRRRALVPLAAALLMATPAVGAAAAGTAPRADDAVLTGPECLVGTWAVDPGDDGERILGILDDVATDIVVTTGEGKGVLSISTDTVTFSLDGETVTEEFTIGDHHYVGTWVTDGELSARYTAQAAYLELEMGSVRDDVEVRRTWTEDGVEVTWPSTVPFHVQGLAPFRGGMGYVCSGDELTFYQPEGGTLTEVFQRYVRLSDAPAPQTPAPAPAPRTPLPQSSANGAAPEAAAAEPAVGSPAFTG